MLDRVLSYKYILLLEDALSRKLQLLHSVSMNVVGFEKLKRDYAADPDFGTIYAEGKSGQQNNMPHYP